MRKPLAKELALAKGLCNNEHMLIGYARVSKDNGQETATQVAALKAAGVERQGLRMKGCAPIFRTINPDGWGAAPL
jgi:hypothetical protein